MINTSLQHDLLHLAISVIREKTISHQSFTNSLQWKDLILDDLCFTLTRIYFKLHSNVGEQFINMFICIV